MLTWSEHVFSSRQHDYLLVIPVLNEGERIRRQLERIAEIAAAVDIVIADGGSTDGSLEPDFLRRVHVRALLVKTGEGKLSAQLRMAYRWALDQGYAGVVTVDGNNKDGVDAIPIFLERLRQGYDYVQGSRYLAGGAAINTPLDRTLAGKLVHAPLLSFGAHRWLSDTTNGFRAYSRAYLEDERTAPFRDIFKVYNLLFYLTVRAGALGYRIAQIPVTRAYPAQEKTPTKISGLRSRVHLLSEAFNAATGAYTPPEGPPQHGFVSSRTTTLVIAGLVAILLAGFTVAFRSRIALSPDSWTLFELSKSIPTDFYHVHVRRAFWEDSAYSAAFPPLWPVLLLLFDAVTHLGAAGGFYLAILAIAGFCVASESAGRRLFDTRWIGLAAGVLLPAHAGALDEILGGRTIPLQLTIYAISLALSAYARFSWIRVVAIGLCGGFALMNRFDALPFVLAMALILPWVTRRLSAVFAYAAAVAFTITPWVVYSRLHFGRWFATDNGRTALSADRDAFVTDWWPQPRPTLFDAPRDWLAKVAGNALHLGPAMLVSTGMLWLVLIVALGSFVWLADQSRPKQADDTAVASWPVQRRAVLGFGLALAAILPSYVVTGYFDERYFAPHFWFVVLAIFGTLASALANREQRDLFGIACFGGAWAIAAVGLAHPPPPVSAPLWTTFPQAQGDAALADCLFAQTRSPVLLSADAVEASRLSAVYGWDTILVPRNFDRLTPGEARQFARKFRVTHLYAVNQNALSSLGSRLPLEPLPNCPTQVRRVG